nr:unnamed protein product [Digitaria exilis]
MVAIENAAERDRMMFPSTSRTKTDPKTDSNGNLENCSDNEPAKRLKTDRELLEHSVESTGCMGRKV